MPDCIAQHQQREQPERLKDEGKKGKRKRAEGKKTASLADCGLGADISAHFLFG